jgi:hypothetical protein
MIPIPLHGGGGTAYPFAPPGLDQEAPSATPPPARRGRPRLIEIMSARLDPGLIGRLFVGAARQEA